MSSNVKKKGFDKKNLDKESMLVGVAILLIGIVVGICLNSGNSFALETSASLGTATSSNATDSNATSSNATSSNATASNATDSNATSSNAYVNDNKLFLNEFEIENANVEAGSKALFRYSTSGACNTSVVLYFAEQNSRDIVFSSTIYDPSNPYFEIPLSVPTGKYYLVEILLYGLNSDGKTFSVYYSSINPNADYFADILNKYVNVTNKNSNNVELKNISLSNKEAASGNKININLDVSSKLKSASLKFKSQDGNSFDTNVNSLNDDPYIIIPSTAKAGEYSLYEVVLRSDGITSKYIYGDNLNFDIKMNIIDTKEKSYIYNNKDITEEIIKDIYNAPEKSEISIDATEKSIVDENIFNTIKGTKKNLIINYEDNYMIFCGNDIVTPKTIDVKITTNIIKKDDNINQIIDDGIVVNFESNGNLPGTALIKLKVTEEMKNIFGDDSVFIYYYNDDSNKFNLVESKLKPNKGYYEFNVDHNSKYVLVKSKLDDSLVVEDSTNNVVDFQMSNKMYLLFAAGGILLIFVTVVIIFKTKNKSKKKKNKED